MWLFDNPKSYPEMLKKIAWTMFFIVLVGLFLFSHFSNSFSRFMSEISLNLVYEKNGIKLCISYIYIPLIFALLENIFKLHDRISDVFRIRYCFDKKVILFHYLSKLGILKKYTKINSTNRSEIMVKIFYKYAGYNNPAIDPHLIFMALGAWCWFWILLDTKLVAIVLGILMSIYDFSWLTIFVVSAIFILLSFLSFCIKKFQCTKYAKHEVDEILSDKIRSTEIKKYLISKLQ